YDRRRNPAICYVGSSGSSRAGEREDAGTDCGAHPECHQIKSRQALFHDTIPGAGLIDERLRRLRMEEPFDRQRNRSGSPDYLTVNVFVAELPALSMTLISTFWDPDPALTLEAPKTALSPSGAPDRVASANGSSSPMR